MQIEIQHRPSYAMASVRLAGGEAIITEPGAMVGMSSGMRIETRMRGGFMQSLARATVGGEGFFTNTFFAPAAGGEILLAPALPGDICHLKLAGETFLVQSGSYLASSDTVVTDAKWSGATTFFGGEGLVMLRCSGLGDLLISSYGAIHEMTLAPGQTFTVDSGHLVAFGQSVGYKLRSVGDARATLLGGEGLVMDMTGPGRIYLQSRSEDAFLAWLARRIPKPASGSG